MSVTSGYILYCKDESTLGDKFDIPNACGHNSDQPAVFILSQAPGVYTAFCNYAFDEPILKWVVERGWVWGLGCIQLWVQHQDWDFYVPFDLQAAKHLIMLGEPTDVDSFFKQLNTAAMMKHQR